MRRASIVNERLKDKQIALAHVPDVGNAVDIFTKWVMKFKLERMLAYLTGGAAGCMHPTITNILAVIGGWLEDERISVQ